MVVFPDTDDPEVYGDAEYLDFSTEEEIDSNTEDDEPEFNNEVEMVVIEEPAIKMEMETRDDNIIQEQEASQVQQASSKWTHASTVNLIQAFQSYETSLVTGTMNMSEIWDKVASKLQESGCNFTPLQCKKKFFSLKQIYDKIKEQEIQCGKSVKEWLYLDLMKPIITEMEKYRSYTTDAWDSPKCEDVKDNANNKLINHEDKQKSDRIQGSYKWEHSAILLLIDQYRKYQRVKESDSISQKVLFRLVEKAMRSEGYNVTAAQCIIKYHSMKKTYKSIKAYNRVNRLIPRRWRYYDLIDSIVQGTLETSNDDPLQEVSETLAEIKSENTTPPHIFKWSRRAIEILATAYREHRPPLNDSKMSRRKVWQIVAQKLRKAGFDVNIPQCKSKISGMLKLYKRNRAGMRSRAWSEKGNWYSKLIESIVEKTPKSVQREVPKRVHLEPQRIEAGKGIKRVDNVLDQLNICEENKKSRHPEPQRIESVSEIKRADNMLDQLIICEENKERRHRENREQRQQLIDIMRRLVDKL